MKNLLMRLFFLTLIAVAITLIVPSLAAQAERPAQGGPPQIPHAKEGHTDCLSCHEKGVNGAPKFPPDHTGRTNDMCLGCHTFKPGAASATAAPTAASTPATLSNVPPPIPHTLEGRDQCLVCHQTGGGGAPKVPADHAGRTNDQCRTCHQPQVIAPVIVPTRVPHVPAAANQNSCADCHLAQGGKSADIVKQYTSSIHAARGVTCTDCHGGDATKKTKEEAMAASAGYVGKPSVQDTPALCASCHARVDLMRQYDIPTDQYSQYQSSVHGVKLARGDTNVATCYICHDQHGTKEVKDPTSNVYPQNIPGLCATCHSNATLMKPYGIPTNQYDLYKKSVHGVALLQKQDPRAPSCATCHGTHGAAPP
ncbi:MAG: ammonia-forming cytochrome c nitrite reductase subunit c552, partial [Chloroflexota bacterium]|nr:ammonia-forming cytochrome c nitrite reductase subunit c552 [Chloroflexota bacterium]